MPDLLRCVDRWGREIVLTEERWRDHVLANRPALSGHEAAVAVTLTDPDFVNHDPYRGSRESFYRASSLPPPMHRAYLKVVVEFRPALGILVGRVITAYPTGKIKPGERRKWP